MNKNLKWLSIILAGLLTGAIIAYAASTYLSIPNQGNIQTPPNITSNPPSIDWGTFTIGNNATWNIANINVTLTNTGDEATQPFSLLTDWLNPLGTVTWNCTNYILLGHSSVVANFILTIDPTTTPQSFNFNLIISD